jgi:hypothetical protein
MMSAVHQQLKGVAPGSPMQGLQVERFAHVVLTLLPHQQHFLWSSVHASA